MNITRLKIHNFRSIIEQEIFVQKFSLFIGANNAGKSTIMNAIRLFYSDFNWSIEDFPKTGAHDEEVWIEIEFKLSDIEKMVETNDFSFLSKVEDVFKYEKINFKRKRFLS